MQPQLMTLLSISKGESIIEENIFEARNKHVAELLRMKADIISLRNGTTFIIKGVDNLQGTVVEAKDLRGGASLILAGLVAEGSTIVLNSSFVQRGYENIELDLSNLGANIKFIKK